MNRVILFHGSTEIVEKPTYGKGKSNNDYGMGFYLTEHIELAKEWACGEKVDGYVNRYEIDTDNLRILNLSSDEFSVMNWLAILLENRIGRLSTPISKAGRDYILKNFLPDYEDFDAIIGYRADDSYFSFVRAFMSNEISIAQLSYAMKLGQLGEQFVIKSKKAFTELKYLDYITVDNRKYYEKRIQRNIKARYEYNRKLERDDLEGVFIRDIIREEIKNNDERLR